jgi:glycerol-3-phosphate dehydrogenase
LIHGGLRYLKYLEFGLVRKSLRERAVLMNIAPEMVRPLPFLMPFYSRRARILYGTGLWLYDLLAGRDNIAAHRSLAPAEVALRAPNLAREGLRSAAVFHDCRVHSTRFVLANVVDAARHGAVVANYARAVFDAGGASVTDQLSGASFRVRARKLVDATGPWERGLRLVRGSHILVPRLHEAEEAIAWFDERGRIVFVIPWDDLSLVGTTDCDHTGGPDDVRITTEEIRYLLAALNRLFPSAGEVRPVGAYSSLRPLLPGASGSPGAASREHRIWNTSDGVLHVAGGKFTTYRAMSEEAADSICREVAPALANRCYTAETRLDPGNRPEAQALRYAVECEMAQRLADVLFVSTDWGYRRRWTAPDLAPLAAEMAGYMGWDRLRRDEEVELALRIAAFPDL